MMLWRQMDLKGLAALMTRCGRRIAADRRDDPNAVADGPPANTTDDHPPRQTPQRKRPRHV